VHVIDSFLVGNAMRGKDDRSEVFFSYLRLEDRIPADHPLRVIRQPVYPTTLTFVKSIFERRPPGSPYDALAPASPARAA
jgi:hypothetical protein